MRGITIPYNDMKCQTQMRPMGSRLARLQNSDGVGLAQSVACPPLAR